MGQKCAGLKNIYNWQRCVVYAVVGTSAYSVRNAFDPYITGGRCTQRPYYEIVKIFEMRYLGWWLGSVLLWGVFYLIENQRCKSVTEFRHKTAESIT